jgi:hypothetical protein
MELQIDIETEKLRKYRPGGFCPVDIGDRISDRFVVLHKLGYGEVVLEQCGWSATMRSVTGATWP